MKKIAAALLIAGALVGCNSVDPYTGEEKVNNTTKGAVGGAIVGALVGQLAGEDTEATLAGAAAGAALGGGAGYYFDRQEKALRSQLANSGVGIKRVGENELQLIMPGNLTFNSSSSAIAPESYTVLNSISKVLAEYNKTKISITGYTDNTGNATINNRLSKERADAVYYYLNGRNIPKTRMEAQGLGSADPIASNSTSEGRAENRRVEIKIIG